MTQICPFVSPNSKKPWDWVLYQYHHMLLRWPLLPAQEQTFHHSDNCSLTAPVIKLLLCQALSTFYSIPSTAEQFVEQHQAFAWAVCARTSNTLQNCWKVLGSSCSHPLSPLGFNQSHQNLPLIVQISEKWGRKRKRVGGDLCVPAECDFCRAQHHRHTSSE